VSKTILSTAAIVHNSTLALCSAMFAEFIKATARFNNIVMEAFKKPDDYDNVQLSIARKDMVDIVIEIENQMDIFFRVRSHFKQEK
jgi:hypothetical protein